MSQETKIFLFRILVPAAIATVGAILLMRGSSTRVFPQEGHGRHDDGGPHDALDRAGVVQISSGWLTLAGGLLCGLALIASDFLAKGILASPSKWFEWEARYQWNWMIWIIPAGILACTLARIARGRYQDQAVLLWPCLLLLSLGTLYVSLMELEAWGDRWQEAIHAILMGLIACILNVLALYELQSSGASKWVTCVLLGQLGCTAALALQIYASLGEWVLACVGVTIGVTLVTLFTRRTAAPFGMWPVSLVIYPTAICAVSCFQLLPFFEIKPLIPRWMGVIVLFLPVVTWFFDYVYGRYGRIAWRVGLAALVNALVLAAIIYITKPYQSEW